MDDAAWEAHLRANAWCADCGSAEEVTWASRAFGVTLCIACSGAHRGTGRSQVLSLTLDRWTPAMRAAFCALGGNAAANARVRQATPPLALGADTPAALRNHYIECKWSDGAVAWRPEAVQQHKSPRTHITNQNAGMLHVKLIHGRGLKAADITGKSDCYAVLALGRLPEKALKTSSCVSHIVKQTLNPDWNESMMLNVPSLEEAVLTIQVWDWDPPPKRHDNLGVAHVDLSSLQDGEPLELALPLSKKGFIRLELTWTRLGK